MTIRTDILDIRSGAGTEAEKRRQMQARRAKGLSDEAAKLSFPLTIQRGGLTVRAESLIRPSPGLIKVQEGRVFDGRREIKLRHSGWQFANVPYLVPDPAGPIDLGPILDIEGNEIGRSRAREDPRAALEEIIFAEGRRLAQTPAGPGEMTRRDTTTTVHADPDDGYIYKYSTTYTTVLTSPGTAAGSTSVADYAGQFVQYGSLNYNYQGFLRFDTTAVGGDTVSAATLSLYGHTDASVADFELRAAVHAWTSPLATGDYIASASLPSKDAGFSTSGWSTSGYNDFTSEAGFPGNINGAGDTEIAVWSSEYEAESPPTGNEYVGWHSADGTTGDPKLVVEHSGGAAGAMPHAIHHDRMRRVA